MLTVRILRIFPHSHTSCFYVIIWRTSFFFDICVVKFIASVSSLWLNVVDNCLFPWHGHVVQLDSISHSCKLTFDTFLQSIATAEKKQISPFFTSNKFGIVDRYWINLVQNKSWIKIFGYLYHFSFCVKSWNTIQVTRKDIKLFTTTMTHRSL